MVKIPDKPSNYTNINDSQSKEIERANVTQFKIKRKPKSVEWLK